MTTTVTYDPAYSQVTSVTDPLTHTTTFGYSPSGALTTVTDALNHTTTITPHATGQPAAIQTPLTHTTQFAYDAGDLVTITDPLGRATQQFLDGAGRVVAATDPLGRTTYYDGLNLVQDKQNATVKANILTGLGLDEGFTRLEGSTTRHLLADALGSTLALTDPAGALQTQYTYAPFGATTSTGPTNTNPFKFTGREDDGTGLYYYRARYYHPGLQRFVSEDPIGFLGGDVNLYSYVRNNPSRFVDPSGLLVRNPNPFPIVVKPNDRNASIGYLPPGHEWPGNPDGVKVPGEPWWKTPIPDWWPFDVPVDIGPGGRPVCRLPPCVGPYAPHQPDDLNWRPDWQPPEIGPLPDIRPIPGRGDNYPPLWPMP